MNDHTESHDVEMTDDQAPQPPVQVHLVHDTAGDIFVPYAEPGRGEPPGYCIALPGGPAA